MIPFKTLRNGFTLIEVLLAIVLIGMILVPLFIAQESVLLSTLKRVGLIDDLIQKEYLLALGRRLQKEDDRTFVQNHETGYTYELSSLPNGSSLASIHGILIETVRKTKNSDQQKNSDSEPLVTFVYKPERIKKDEQTRGNIN